MGDAVTMSVTDATAPGPDASGEAQGPASLRPAAPSRAEIRRTRRRAARRDAMLDAAMAIVLEDGVEGLTIGRLAERMGMAVGAMYRYFSGKSGLVAALQERAVASLAVDLARAADAAVTRAEGAELSPGRAALVRACAAALSYLSHAVHTPERHRLIDASLSSPKPLLDDEGARAVAVVLEGLLGQVAGHLAVAAAQGALAPGDALARTHVLWATVHGLDHLRKRDRHQPAALRSGALAGAALADLLRGWGCAPALAPDIVRAAAVVIPREP